MLVLTRREGETIVIPGLGISIHITAIKSGHVRIGLEAPADVKFLRAELPDRDGESDELGQVARAG